MREPLLTCSGLLVVHLQLQVLLFIYLFTSAEGCKFCFIKDRLCFCCRLPPSLSLSPTCPSISPFPVVLSSFICCLIDFPSTIKTQEWYSNSSKLSLEFRKRGTIFSPVWFFLSCGVTVQVWHRGKAAGAGKPGVKIWTWGFIDGLGAQERSLSVRLQLRQGRDAEVKSSQPERTAISPCIHFYIDCKMCIPGGNAHCPVPRRLLRNQVSLLNTLFLLYTHTHSHTHTLPHDFFLPCSWWEALPFALSILG